MLDFTLIPNANLPAVAKQNGCQSKSASSCIHMLLCLILQLSKTGKIVKNVCQITKSDLWVQVLRMLLDDNESQI